MRGHQTEKADVFSFGVSALEIVSGRPNSDSNLEREKIYLLEWVVLPLCFLRAWQLHETNSIVELVDPRLSSDFDEEEFKRIVGIALLCTQTSPLSRPAMSCVVAMLSRDMEVSTVTSRPGYLTDWKFDDEYTFMTGLATKGSDMTLYNSSTTASQSPVDASEPILPHIVGEGS